jgi:hypothetical protein
LLKEQIERSQMGMDPLAIVRDPDHAIIDTNLQEAIDELAERRGGGGRNAAAREAAPAGD